MKDASKMTAQQVVALLREKHLEDVFVAECKNGPTQRGTHFRMDVWTMAKSWSNPCVSAYEVKVSRGDFLNDNKWRQYLECCNQFSFVCPRGIIRPDELPADVGLYYVASTGKMLTTQRKPVWRDVAIPESVWRYILMCRTQIKGEDMQEASKAEHFRLWLATREENRKLGYEVGRAIRQHVESVERENDRLKQKMSEYDDVRTVLTALGWKEPDKELWLSGATVKRKIESLHEVFPPYLVRDIERLEKALEQTRRHIEDFQKSTNEKAKATPEVAPASK